MHLILCVTMGVAQQCNSFNVTWAMPRLIISVRCTATNHKPVNWEGIVRVQQTAGGWEGKGFRGGACKQRGFFIHFGGPSNSTRETMRCLRRPITTLVTIYKGVPFRTFHILQVYIFNAVPGMCICSFVAVFYSF